VEKPSLQHQSASSEKNADHNLVNNKALAKNKKKLCDKKSECAPKKKVLVTAKSSEKQCPVVESIIDSSDFIEKTCKVGK
jgi:hypothetical protein